jgi:hypothetical protein
MKNIHVLPTDKPSRYWMTRLGNLTRCHDIKPIKEALGNNVNISITNDEEIKKGDWFIFEGNLHEAILVKDNHITPLGCFGLSHDKLYCKKIILTTDQDLIKDGVQAIDDDFLEWFVKNPSCEEVKTKLIEQIPNGITFGMFGNDEPPTELIYKIIIPKEEPTIVDKLKEYFNTTSKEQIQKDWEETCKQTEGIISPTVDEFIKAQETLEELKFKNRQIGAAEFVANKIMENMISKPKQETLEELAEKYSINEFPLKDFEGNQWNNQRANCKQDFLAGAKAGAKWQQEQDKNKYSEEDMQEYAEFCIRCYNEGLPCIVAKDWVKQFKKK